MGEDIIKRELEEGEELKWSGKPERRLIARGDAIRIPASLILAGVFVYYWMAKGVEEIGVVMVVVVFLALALVIYNTIAKLIIKEIQMGRTYYGMTDHRLIFVMLDRKGVRKRMAEIEIGDMRSDLLEMWKEDIGSVVFSDKPQVDARSLRGGSNWVTYPYYVTPVFFEIKGAEKFYSAYKALKKTIVKDEEPSEDEEERFSKFDM